MLIGRVMSRSRHFSDRSFAELGVSHRVLLLRYESYEYKYSVFAILLAV